MVFPQKVSKNVDRMVAVVAAFLALATGAYPAGGQSAPPSSADASGRAPSTGFTERLQAMMAGGKSAWTPEQMAVMERLRDAAMRDPYALDELRHLSYNIGPRLSGSPQAAKAV